jgi:hypothetical protein
MINVFYLVTPVRAVSANAKCVDDEQVHAAHAISKSRGILGKKAVCQQPQRLPKHRKKKLIWADIPQEYLRVAAVAFASAQQTAQPIIWALFELLGPVLSTSISRRDSTLRTARRSRTSKDHRLQQVVRSRQQGLPQSGAHRAHIVNEKNCTKFTTRTYLSVLPMRITIKKQSLHAMQAFSPWIWCWMMLDDVGWC